MGIERLNIVRAVAGRDQGKLFIVTAVEGEYLWLVDGKGRKTETPKRKKCKHVQLVAAGDDRLFEKIKNNAKLTNSEIRRVLAVYREEIYPDQEG